MNKNTPRRFNRIVAMLIHLQSRRVVKAQELADRFEVSLRTVYRDIRTLETSGVPISGEAGVGYFITEGYRLPPVMFTREEAGSFVAAEKLMQKFSDKMLGSHYESAMYKIKSVLRGTVRDRIAALESQIRINSSHEIFNENAPDALNILFECIAEKMQVSIKYLSAYSDAETTRCIEPVGLFNENNYWYVMAFCHLRKDYRQFRTDRIMEIRGTDQPFSAEHGNIDDYRSSPDPGPKTRIVLRVDKETARYMKNGRKYYGFLSEKDLGEKVEMTFLSPDVCDAFPRWFLMFGDCAEIIEPDILKERVLELLEKTRKGLEKKATDQSSSSIHR